MARILILGKYYPPEFGGVERYTRDLAHLVSKTHDVTVVAHSKTPNDSSEQRGSVRVLRCGTKAIVASQPLSPSMAGHLRRQLATTDIVIFNAPNFWSATLLLLLRYRGPIVVVHHADVFGRPVLRRIVIAIYHAIVRRSCCIVVNSHKNAGSSRDLPDHAGPFVSIPHGTDPAQFEAAADKSPSIIDERRLRYGSSPIIGFIGRLVRYKGIFVLIEAIAALKDAQCLLIGTGPLREAAEQQAKELGVADRVHFIGDPDDKEKIRLMAMFDLFVLPSTDTTEAFGIAQVEAQLCGLPIVTSDLPTGVTDVTLDGETGVLVPPGDSRALADAIQSLLNDPARANQYGKAGRERALRNFTLDIFSRRFNELIDTILKKQPIQTLEGYRPGK